MRMVFVGATHFGRRCLGLILALREITVVGLVTNPRVFSISYRGEGVSNVLHADLSDLAAAHGLPLWIMTDRMTEPGLVAAVRSWRPDFILVAGWYHMVPREIRKIAPTAGLHASLLPDYSGGAPLVWAIINGEKRTGITLFLLDEGVDNGPIIGQAEEPIRNEDTIATLYARIEEAGLRLLEEQLPLISRGAARYRPQDESRRRIMPQRGPEDGLIDWHWAAPRIYDFVRAQTRPYPGAFTWWQGRKLTIWKSRVAAPTEAALLTAAEAGTVVGEKTEDGGVLVACGASSHLLLEEVEADGGPMSGSQWLREQAALGRRLGT